MAQDRRALNVASVSLRMFAQAMDRFLGSNAPRSAFASMRRDMMQVPMLTRVLLSVGVVTAAEVGEGQAKPVRRLTLSTSDTETSKSVAQVVLSKEGVTCSCEARRAHDRLGHAGSCWQSRRHLFSRQARRQREWRRAAAEANPSWSAILDELFELLNLVSTGEASRLWLIVTPRISRISPLAAPFENGVTTLLLNGRQLLGVNVIASASSDRRPDHFGGRLGDRLRRRRHPGTELEVDRDRDARRPDKRLRPERHGNGAWSSMFPSRIAGSARIGRRRMRPSASSTLIASRP